MQTLAEARLQHMIEHAQFSLYLHDHYYHDRDASYREVLEFVDELVDLVSEVRREKSALEQIVRLWEERGESYGAGASDAELARRMYTLACLALRQAQREEQAAHDRRLAATLTVTITD